MVELQKKATTGETTEGNLISSIILVESIDLTTTEPTTSIVIT